MASACSEYARTMEIFREAYETAPAERKPKARCDYLEATLEYIQCIISVKLLQEDRQDLKDLQRQAEALERTVKDQCNRFQGPSDADVQKIIAAMAQLHTEAVKSAAANTLLSSLGDVVSNINKFKA